MLMQLYLLSIGIRAVEVDSLAELAHVDRHLCRDLSAARCLSERFLTKFSQVLASVRAIHYC